MKSGRVTARPWKALDETAADGIGNKNENNWDGMRLLKHGRSSGGAARENEVGLKRDEFLSEAFHQLDVSRRPANIDLDVAALEPPEFPKFFPKRCQRGLPVLVALGGGRQNTEPAHPFGLLRVGCSRPRQGRTAKKLGELAPPHEASPLAEILAPLTLTHPRGDACRASQQIWRPMSQLGQRTNPLTREVLAARSGGTSSAVTI